MKAEHENFFFLSSFGGFIFLSEDGGTGFCVICVEDDVVAFDELSIGEADAGYDIVFRNDFGDFCAETKGATFFFDDLGHCFGDFDRGRLGHDRCRGRIRYRRGY